MRRLKMISRRALLAALPTIPAISCKATADDSGLIALGREFDALAAIIDDTTDMASIDRLLALDTAIIATPANTVSGLCVKARAACSARLGDLDPSGEETTDRRMGLSIIRDLIRLYDPEREVPNALRELVAEFARDRQPT